MKTRERTGGPEAAGRRRAVLLVGCPPGRRRERVGDPRDRHLSAHSGDQPSLAPRGRVRGGGGGGAEGE